MVVRQIDGPTYNRYGVQYVEAMKGLVTYGEDGELFPFDAAGECKCWMGPTRLSTACSMWRR